MVFGFLSSNNAPPLTDNDDSTTAVEPQETQQENEDEPINENVVIESSTNDNGKVDVPNPGLPSIHHDDTTETWSQSHLETCLRLQSLVATPQQVWDGQEEGSELDMPLVQNVVVLTAPKEESIREAAIAVCDSFQKEQHRRQEQSSSNTSSNASPSLFGQLGGALYKLMWAALDGGEPDPDDLEEWNPQTDDANLAEDELGEQQRVDWNAKVFNVDLAVTCFQQLVQQHQRQDELLILRVQPNKNSENATPCLLSWCHEIGQTGGNDLLQHVSQMEAVILARALEKLGKAKFVSSDTLLAVGSSLESPTLDVAVALFELDCALLAAEQRIANYESKALRAEKEALEAKRRGNSKLAVSKMKQRKMFSNQVELSRGAVLNLETTRLTLEQSQSQKEILASLEATNQALQSMRNDNAVNIEKVDDVVLDQQELAEDIHEVDQALAKIAINESSMEHEVSEADLLKELEELSEETIEASSLSKQTFDTEETTPESSESTAHVGIRATPTSSAESQGDGEKDSAQTKQAVIASH